MQPEIGSAASGPNANLTATFDHLPRPRYDLCVNTHEDIDRRSLEMARRIVARIDADPERRGLAHAREVCRRWVAGGNRPAAEWQGILERPWEEVRRILLDDSEDSRRLRQNDPFCGILTPVERWDIYRESRREAK